MARMEKVTPNQPALPTTTIETVTKRTEQMPAAGPAGSQPYKPASRTVRDDPSVWFKGLAPEERNDYAYYLYRLDPNIVIMDPNLDDRARGAMLDKLTVPDIQQLGQGDFIDELKLMLKRQYGGGKFQIKIVHLKGGTMIHNRALVIEGNPVLSKREGWTGPGMPPSGQSGGGDSQLIPIIMKVIDEKLSGINQRREDPGLALTEAMKAVGDIQSNAFRLIMERMPNTPEPAQRLAEIKEMLQIFATLKGEDKPALAPVDPMTQIRQMLEMMKLLRDAEAPPATNVGEVIKNAIAEGIKQFGPARRAVGPAFTETIVDVVKAASPLLAPIGLAIAEKIKHAPLPGVPAYAMPPGVAAAGAPRASQGIGAARGNAMLGASPIGAVAAAPAPPASPGAVQPTVLTDDLLAAASWHTVTTRLVDMLTHDISGDQAAAALSYIFPEVTVRMRTMTAEMLTSFIQQDVTLAQIKDDPRLPEFIGEFLAYFQAPDAPETEPPPEEV